MINMDKKLQVFISSTYLDLEEIRTFTYRSILELGHIPVGTEFLGVQKGYTPESYALRCIDTCEFVIMIVDNRYGSVSHMDKSYVEEEYLYSLKKINPYYVF